ncbi:GNAT family N-acetyltransferase [Halpernia sp.]|uniref:GNAT family N-acetyltransferase n=1 Tax=Halpernia sp. TaxID=2782209 RepID=UPI003A92F536
MKIKKATEKDIPLIREIAEKSWRANYPGIISNDQIDYMLDLMYSEKEIKSQFQNPNYHYYLILNDENSTVGILGFENSYENETTKLHRIYLLKETKGKGFGKFALNFLANEVLNLGDKRIILNVNKENPAIEFYKSQGFETYKEDIFDIGNGFVMDDYLMEFKI